MEIQEMLELEASLRALEQNLFTDERLFIVWRELHNARELLGTFIRGEREKRHVGL